MQTDDVSEEVLKLLCEILLNDERKTACQILSLQFTEWRDCENVVLENNVYIRK
jgi:hypothetical protein